MEGLHLFSAEQWTPLAYFGLTDPIFALDRTILIHTWIMMLMIAALVGIIRFFVSRHHAVIYFLATSFAHYFVDTTVQTLGTFSFAHFSFVTSIFIFLSFANTLAIIPYLEEPSTNLNTTLALGIIAFLYIQAYAIKHHGWWAYIKDYFSPFFLMFPLHVMGKLATIISMSFRLFGNIFGGSTITHIYMGLIKSSVLIEVVGLLGPNLGITLFFGIFEGLLQAFVFAMLTMTYLSIAIQEEEHEPQAIAKEAA
ncbi:MAG TPA: FoF1 ATP synthase subunit a [Candidatus Limnocylindria bacterium]|nr:FoF1 ATP synthase subunit a [Candidatus Limnocylindria bacterium]